LSGKGAWELTKKYPLFGSGVETFAYSYYNVRPVEHNLVTEWDFLYNKAHNEFLNYAATTGFVGSRCLFIFSRFISLVVYNTGQAQ
jgi:putative inorganic carbon (hco3(-)) transporter